MKKTDYEKLAQALDRLQEKYNDYQEMETRSELKESDKDSIKESLIHRFEICYDTLWKHLKKHFDGQGLVDVPSSPKLLSRLARENGLVDEDTLQHLLGYVQTRIDTAHDYSMEKAEKALGVIGSFIEDMTELYEKMTAEK